MFEGPNEEPIKHGVLMVTYNQERFIGEALASVFNNSVMPHKVYLNDDSSRDGTWSIIERYMEAYPRILEARRNESNVGMYANFNLVWKRGKESDCDILSWCSGDDYLMPRVFEHMNAAIRRSELDPSSTKLIVITNSLLARPDGSRKLVNNFRFRNGSIRLERLAKRLSYREVGIGRKTIEGVSPIRSDIGFTADLLYAMEYEANCRYYLFSKHVGSVYRQGVGVVSKGRIREMFESEGRVYEAVLKKYGASLDNRERGMAEIWVTFSNLMIKTSYRLWLHYCLTVFSNIGLWSRMAMRLWLGVLPPPFITGVLSFRARHRMRSTRKLGQ